MVDLFNNTSNDYINPVLSPCPGNSNDSTIEFTNQELVIYTGNTIVSSLNLANFVLTVEGYVQQTKILESGEIIYIPGLTKGISQRTQYFPFIGDVSNYDNIAYHEYYMSVDLSVNYYKNFKYYNINIFASGDFINGINIADELNMQFDNYGIGITATYDSSGLTFKGDNVGYTFTIDNVDVSLWLPDTSVYGEILIEDSSSSIPSVKYPNGAMLGYGLTVTYPSTVDSEDEWIEINHVPNYLEYFEPSTENVNSYIRYYKAVDVGMNGSSSDTTISAADYLDMVQTKNRWEKVGGLKMWFTAPDPANSIQENLISGFYIFNPQLFPVKIDYLVII